MVLVQKINHYKQHMDSYFDRYMLYLSPICESTGYLLVWFVTEFNFPYVSMYNDNAIFFFFVQDITERHTKIVRINICPETFYLWVAA
jgi:hypothetical protein